MYNTLAFDVVNQEAYLNAKPYRFIKIDNFLDDEVAEKVYNFFPAINDNGWIHYVHFNENKHGLNKVEFFPKEISDVIIYLTSPDFVKELSKFTQIPNLIADPDLEGGGIHQSKRGGKLNIHTDFIAHPHQNKWRRRINLLIYFNKNWLPEYNGDLEIWDEKCQVCEHKISPIFNRAVIFATDATSFHGVPDSIKCPESDTRKSIALYYYTIDDSLQIVGSTNYKHRPADSLFDKILIWVDKKAIFLYTFLKRKLGFNDDFISKILQVFNKK